MKKKLSLCMLIVFFMSFTGMSGIQSTVLAEGTVGQIALQKSHDSDVGISIDSKKTDEMPKRFRKTTDEIKSEGKIPDLTGLATLNASGSAQFTGGNIKMMKDAIGSKNITVVDLRQESHGFINDMAVSWKPKGSNKANKGLTKRQVKKDEKKKLKSIELNKKTKIDGKTITPTKVQSEKQLTKQYDMGYIRIPVTDTEKPDDDMVDYFVETVKKLPEDTWLHFHCKAGIGRTTTFMTMYDIMKNGKKVSLQDIMDRQVLLGGKNLLKPEDGKESESHKRSDLIRNFYKYVNENNDDFKTSWQDWLKANKS